MSIMFCFWNQGEIEAIILFVWPLQSTLKSQWNQLILMKTPLTCIDTYINKLIRLYDQLIYFSKNIINLTKYIWQQRTLKNTYNKFRKVN